MNHRHAIEVVPDAASAATRAAEWWIEQVDHAVQKRGRAVVALSGGSTPRAVYECLSRPPWRDRVRWDRIEFFFGDERYVADGADERNDRMARESLLSGAGVDPTRVHAMPHDPTPGGSNDATHGRAECEAQVFDAKLKAFYGADVLEPDRPFFDVVMLGLGEDGHTASIFPGTPAVDERVRWAMAVAAAQTSAPTRITLTWPMLESTHAVLFLVTGEGKREVVKRVLDGDESLPAARLRPKGGTLWIIDEPASTRGR